MLQQPQPSVFSGLFHFALNMKHLQLYFDQSDFHLPEEGLIIPTRSCLLGLTSSNREWRGTDFRKKKKPLPQATRGPTHHRYQKDQLHSFPNRTLLGENELAMKTHYTTRGCHSTLESERDIPISSWAKLPAHTGLKKKNRCSKE